MDSVFIRFADYTYRARTDSAFGRAVVELSDFSVVGTLMLLSREQVSTLKRFAGGLLLGIHCEYFHDQSNMYLEDIPVSKLGLLIEVSCIFWNLVLGRNYCANFDVELVDAKTLSTRARRKMVVVGTDNWNASLGNAKQLSPELSAELLEGLVAVDSAPYPRPTVGILTAMYRHVH